MSFTELNQSSASTMANTSGYFRAKCFSIQIEETHIQAVLLRN